MPKSCRRTFEKHGKVVWLLERNFGGLESGLFEDTSSVVTSVATDLGHPYWIYIIPTHDKHQWLLLQFLVLLMMDAESVRNM